MKVLGAYESKEWYWCSMGSGFSIFEKTSRKSSADIGADIHG
jgi:hypothetical protein